ncbi:hypothetical protein B0T25DRAFT_114813 [Lasiosphaeria hispida]|uniref:Uncharacterized protein n=1 Tax=Lasiosphaeria hispida TaxID=260671 RepID=A0AAJ0HR60_9PEZI|nr:hypothetical protein B0T25DRAFT_114813 [Lasiosphaeria hispida]
MELAPPASADALDLDIGTGRPPAPTRKRSTSGGLLSKLPFMRSGENSRPRSRRSTEETDPLTSTPNSLPIPSFRTIPAGPPPLSHAILQQQTQQQQKTRRRRGSLRKVALLGRGAQRERREARGLTIDTKFLPVGAVEPVATTAAITSSPRALDGTNDRIPLPLGYKEQDPDDTFGLGISDITPRPSMDGYASRSAPPLPTSNPITPTDASTNILRSPQDAPGNITDSNSTVTSPSISYSTTDDEDGLHMAGPASRPTTPSLSLSSSSSLLRPERTSLSSGSESYFPNGHGHLRSIGLGSSSAGGGGGNGNGSESAGAGGISGMPSIQHRRSTIQRAKSPLALTSLAGLSTTPLPAPDADWDYAETEWWGWVVLIVTWTVFVIGMGSCFGVWSWAWDVGTTPYAPPELEDDPTLPIVGYYPALMILTGVMAWVWVVVAWVGMKYFRHARVSGD